jgi:hypothetical protein
VTQGTWILHAHNEDGGAIAEHGGRMLRVSLPCTSVEACKEMGPSAPMIAVTRFDWTPCDRTFSTLDEMTSYLESVLPPRPAPDPVEVLRTLFRFSPQNPHLIDHLLDRVQTTKGVPPEKTLWVLDEIVRGCPWLQQDAARLARVEALRTRTGG